MKTATRTATARAASAKPADHSVHVANDYVLGEGAGAGSPRFQWVRVLAGAITSLLVGVGLASAFGWMTEALMSLVAVTTGSLVAAMGVYYLGIIVMLVSAFFVLPKVWDHVVSGRTEEAMSAGFARVRGWFTKSETA